MLKLRPYQIDAHNIIRKEIQNGHKRIITQLATGGGKTATFIALADAARMKNKKIIIVIKRRTLIFQTVLSYYKFTGFKPSVCMASEKGFDPNNPVQIVSIDTINRRINRPEYQFLKNFNIVIVDEVHDAVSTSYKSFLNELSSAFWFGFSATVLPVGNKYLIEWDVVNVALEPIELRDQGYLVSDVTYAPKKIDTSGIKTIAGDYDQKALAERAMDSKIVGDTVDVYKTHGQNRPTLLFCVNIEHSKLSVEKFKQAGIPAMHLDQSHSQQERETAISMLKKGLIKILSSINVLSTGTDVPMASCVILARPTKSEILYVQQVGRGLRPFKICAICNAECGGDKHCLRCGSTSFSFVKKDCIILDQANNCERFGLAFDARYAQIRPPVKKKRAEKDPELDIKTKTCESCFAVYSIENSKCPICDHQNAKTEREIKEEEGELQRVKSEQLRYAIFIKIKNDLMKLSNPKWKDSAKWVKLHAIHGDIIFDFRNELEMPRWVKTQITKLTRK